MWRGRALTADPVLAGGGGLDLDVSEFYEETRVRFSQLSEELLWEYIHSGEPMWVPARGGLWAGEAGQRSARQRACRLVSLPILGLGHRTDTRQACFLCLGTLARATSS